MGSGASRRQSQYTSSTVRFLILGDVVARPGREAISRALPALRRDFNPDHVIINIENIAHGSGIAPAPWQEAQSWNADVYTLGDHAWGNDAGHALLEDTSLPIVRPANYPDKKAGRGYHIFRSGAYHVAVINLQGQVFFDEPPENPFHVIDTLLEHPDITKADIRLIDFQAEATSEKRGLGWHVDGRISALWGTHTHVPTADAHILPDGTGYITDVGFCGNHHSVIGLDRRESVRHFLTGKKIRRSYDDGGPLEIGGAVIDIDPRSGHTTRIEHVRRIIS